MTTTYAIEPPGLETLRAEFNAGIQRLKKLQAFLEKTIVASLGEDPEMYRLLNQYRRATEKEIQKITEMLTNLANKIVKLEKELV